MKLTKTFEKSKIEWYGDDSYCHGVHFGQDGCSEVINYLDNLVEKYEGKNVKITISVEVEE